MAEEHMSTGYRKLRVWQKADELVILVYKFSKNFPKDEMFGLTSQLRRAAASIPINIAEGMGRQSKNETRQFLNIALGSLSETEYLLDLCFRLKYFTETDFQVLEKCRQELGGMLWNFL